MKFIDLQVTPMVTSEMEEMLTFGSELGYAGIGLEFNRLSVEDARKAEKVAEILGIDLVTRINLTPNDPEELLNFLKKTRLQYEVVAVTCLNHRVAKQAAKDHRVDLLDFPVSCRPSFDEPTAQLASTSNAALELTIAEIIMNIGSQRVMAISKLRKEVKIARRFKVPVILSSGSQNIYQLRGPKEIIATASIIGLTQRDATEALSTGPLKMVETNRKKLSPDYVQGASYVERRKSFACKRE
jgi:ribonuclease P/MRP protein subunit RPP1